MQKYFSILEVAGILKVPTFQIYALANSGMMKAFKIGKHWRIPEDGLEEYINRQIKTNTLR